VENCKNSVERNRNTRMPLNVFFLTKGMADGLLEQE